jgi:hypothetical protein
MKHILLILFLLFSFQALAKKTPNYHIMDLEFTNNLPFVYITVEDQKARCLVDTGARNGVLVLQKDIVAKLKTIVPFAVKEKTSDLTGKKYIAQKYILPKFNMGDLHFLQLRLSEDTNWGVGGGEIEGKDGVIGLELFLDKGIIIDYANKKFVVVDGKIPAEYDVDNWHELTFKVDRFGVSLFVRMDDEKETRRFILDTGSNVSIIKPELIDYKDSAIPNLKLYDLDLGKILIYNYNLPIDFEPDGILGYNFLEGRAIYIDFDKRTTKLR